MLKERAHKLRVSSNLRRLFGNPWRYFLALLKRALCDASDDVAPHQLTQIGFVRKGASSRATDVTMHF